MKYAEVHEDLFTKDGEGVYFAHCIAADYRLGAGIAVPFNKKYDLRRRLNKLGRYAFPDVIKLDNVYNLVTKQKSHLKPTYDDLRSSLYLLRDMIEVAGVKKLVIPRIGCGLDGLDWEKVSAMIQYIFSQSDVEITVCIWE